ncbi:GNAT family N-acetyltransferase [Acholeplasma sp. OttesenSCG-928-E16]|nr:GNAT family N-acetyltransferase [Acholeplasma sp. OttesenSCG-928-E16]
MIHLRQAEEKDIKLIIWFINELAIYEKMKDEVIVTEELIRKWVFNKKIAHVIIAEYDSKPVGFALYFFNYSTFLGKAGLYLEDLYVIKEYRKKKIGITLFKELASIAVKEDCGRMEWSCLKWNEPSIRFYEKLGAIRMEEWDTYRLTRDKIESLKK